MYKSMEKERDRAKKGDVTDMDVSIVENSRLGKRKREKIGRGRKGRMKHVRAQSEIWMSTFRHEVCMHMNTHIEERFMLASVV